MAQATKAARHGNVGKHGGNTTQGANGNGGGDGGDCGNGDAGGGGSNRARALLPYSEDMDCDGAHDADEDSDDNFELNGSETDSNTNGIFEFGDYDRDGRIDYHAGFLGVDCRTWRIGEIYYDGESDAERCTARAWENGVNMTGDGPGASYCPP